MCRLTHHHDRYGVVRVDDHKPETRNLEDKTMSSKTSSSRRHRAVEKAGVIGTMRQWIAGAWQYLKAAARRLWHHVRGTARFARDLGRLVWCYIFNPSEFAIEKLRFQARHLSVEVDTRALALSLRAALQS